MKKALLSLSIFAAITASAQTKAPAERPKETKPYTITVTAPYQTWISLTQTLQSSNYLSSNDANTLISLIIQQISSQDSVATKPKPVTAPKKP